MRLCERRWFCLAVCGFEVLCQRGWFQRQQRSPRRVVRQAWLFPGNRVLLEAREVTQNVVRGARAALRNPDWPTIGTAGAQTFRDAGVQIWGSMIGRGWRIMLHRRGGLEV